MRQALNQVNIEGILNEVDLKENIDKNGRNYISGTVTLLVKQMIAGIPEDDFIPVRVFAYQKTNRGTDNPAYTSAYELLHNGVSMRATGDENSADRYQVSGASIRENSFVGRDGNLVSYTCIQGSFFRKVMSENYSAKFKVEPIIWNMRDEMENGEPTGRLLVDTVIIQYNDTPDEVTFVVERSDAIDYMLNNYEKYDTVKVDGRIRYMAKTETYVPNEQIGFGEVEADVREKIVKEFVITTGSAGPLDEERSYNKDEVIAAINQKKARLSNPSASRFSASAGASKVTRGF